MTKEPILTLFGHNVQQCRKNRDYRKRNLQSLLVYIGHISE